MTFFSNPNRGPFPPSYGQFGPQRPFRQQQYFNGPANSFGTQQQDYYRAMNPFNSWAQDFNSYNMQQPFTNQFNSQQQFFNPEGFQQEQNFAPNNRRQQPFRQPTSIMNDFDTLMGHVGTISNGLNTMRQIGSMLGLIR